MRKFVCTIMVMVSMMMAMSFTSFADDGITSTVEESGFSFSMPEEETHDEPSDEPSSEETHDDAPAADEQPSNEEPSKAEQHDEPSEETHDDASAADEQPATTTNVEQKVEVLSAEMTADPEPTVTTKKVAAKKATGTSNEVLGVTRTLPAPQRVAETFVEDEEKVQDNDTEVVEATPWGLILALILALLAFAGIALYLLGLGRKYEVVLRETDENGEQETTSLKKFFNAEKAAEYIRDYLYDNQDSEYVLNLYNNSRDGEEELEDGTKVQKDFVYYVSQDRTAEMILWADDDEVDAIERILGFVSVEA